MEYGHDTHEYAAIDEEITWNAWMMIAAMMTKTRLTRVSQTRVAIQ